MGADGHIKIYDLDKLKEVIPNPFGYIYQLIGKNLLVTYFGDSPPGYEVPACLVCGEVDCFDEAHSKLRDDAESTLLAKWEVWT